jgi:hypothetical protein
MASPQDSGAPIGRRRPYRYTATIMRIERINDPTKATTAMTPPS